MPITCGASRGTHHHVGVHRPERQVDDLIGRRHQLIGCAIAVGPLDRLVGDHEAAFGRDVEHGAVLELAAIDRVR